MFYAIEIIGYGKRRRFTVKLVCNKGTFPTNGKTYRTESEAMEAAAEMGFTIEKIGDFYTIIH